MRPERSHSSITDEGTERSQAALERRIGLRELRAFVTVADAGSFRGGAGRVRYTQSAVSHQIAALETALGVELFVRPGGRGKISLTPSGEVAYRHARRALAAVETMAADARHDRANATVVRVGSFGTASAELLPAALVTFSRECPGVEVVMSKATETSELISSLVRGDLDVAFVLNPPDDPRIEVVSLDDDPWVILTSTEHPVTASEGAGFEALDGARLVAWNLHWNSQAELEDALARRGIRPDVVYRTDDNLALQRLVSAGLGHACIGRLAAKSAADPKLRWFQPPESIVHRRIALAYPRERDIPTAVKSLVDAVRTQSLPGQQ